MRNKIQLDEVSESVRRARAIAHLTQIAADVGNDVSVQVSLAMCVIEDLLAAADESLNELAQ